MKAIMEWNGKPVELDLNQRIIIMDGDEGEKLVLMYMPGYDDLVQIRVHGIDHPMWGWNGDVFAPTFSPSILTRIPRGTERVEMVNHVFVRCGAVQYLSDCTHSLAGQTIPLPKLYEWPEEVRLWD